MLEPDRTDTNIRLYSDEELRKLLNVSLLVNNGFKISKVARLSNEEVAERVLAVTERKNTGSDYIDQLVLLMLNFDDFGINKLAGKIIEEFGVEVAVTNVFFSVFQRIGTYWQVGSIFPAQEHCLTNIIRQRLIIEIDKLEPERKNGMTILFFLPDNEMHEMSLLFYSYMAKKMGYHAVYLGQFVPLEDLRKIPMHLKIDYVFSAFINAISKDDLEIYLQKMKNIFVHQKIFVTGHQFEVHHPELPRNVKVVKDYKEFLRYLS